VQTIVTVLSTNLNKPKVVNKQVRKLIINWKL